MNKLYLLPFLLFFSLATFAQDTIVHVNGGIFIVNLIEQDSQKVFYKLYDQPESRIFHLEKSSIFSISKGDGEQEVLYRYDPNIGNIYQVDEMRLFIKGEQDAGSRYRSRISNIASIIGGAAGGVVLGQGGILGLTAPLVTSALLSIPNPKIRPKTVRDMRYYSLQAYQHGYLREAKKKRYLKSLLLSSISLGISTAITALLID